MANVRAVPVPTYGTKHLPIFADIVPLSPFAHFPDGRLGSALSECLTIRPGLAITHFQGLRVSTWSSGRQALSD